MGIKTINMVHHLMERYGETIETDPKEKQQRFYDALETTIPIEKCFGLIDDCI